ncbi:MAG: hypothetical protein MK106_05740 [Mariniblastus sp.]|nr:hypothetical protein [Mariniblastus sp.]
MKLQYALNTILLIGCVLVGYGQAAYQTPPSDNNKSLDPVNVEALQTDSADKHRNEVWFVSARSIKNQTKDLSKLIVQKHTGGRWNASSLSELCQRRQESPKKKTVIYIHGNRTDQFWAKHRGQQVYKNLFSRRPPTHTALRFIIWSWKSDKTKHGARDFNLKSQRAINLGTVFSETLNALGRNDPPLLIGYSLGCQIIAQAMLEQASLPERPRYNMAFIAPVLNCHFSFTKPVATAASPPSQHTIMFVNRKDLAVRLAKQICSRQTCGNSRSFEDWVRSNQQPLGNVQWRDITSESDFRHSILKYSGLPTVRRSIANLLESHAPLVNAMR